MAADIIKLVEAIKSGKYSRRELETLRKNAESRGAEEVVSTCEEMLSRMSESKESRGRKTKDQVVELRNGISIMSSAYGDDNELLHPEFVAVSEELSCNQHVEKISILKTQIRLYYKGRYFTSGKRPNKKVFWLSILDENKITDSTVECWKKIGNIYRGKYFSTYYVGVGVDDMSKLHSALDCVVFT